MSGNFLCFRCCLLTFSKLTFTKNFFQEHYYIKVSNGLDPDQDQHFVCPDLGPNFLQRLSTDDRVTVSKERVNQIFLEFK